MRAVGLLLCGLGMLVVAGCDSATPAPSVQTVTVTPSASPPASSSPSSSGPSSGQPPARVFDARTMESSVRRLLAETYQVQGIGAVVCPDRQPVADGAKFQCTVDIAGARKHVPIAVTGTSGEYKVDPPR
ncbi:DUF4333 domain-containing protein [Amycolatopsis benzoatilytica]|uniref:DUF4333 domain-containing protein n=1 Tax=Amycolatopsis benzoatilytica TaxID=346045 RepID=UPI0003720723|nr:DUF4333 domain-containing protein [Amycolatopsis benzoatilytica]